MEWINVERKLLDSGASVLVAASELIALASWDAVESIFWIWKPGEAK